MADIYDDPVRDIDSGLGCLGYPLADPKRNAKHYPSCLYCRDAPQGCVHCALDPRHDKKPKA